MFSSNMLFILLDDRCIILVAGVQAVIVVAEDASQFDQIIELSNKCVCYCYRNYVLFR